MRLFALALFALAACAPVTNDDALDVNGPFAVVGPDCTNPSTPLGVGVLDLAQAPTFYLALFAPSETHFDVVESADLTYTLQRGDFDDVTLRAPQHLIAESCGECDGVQFGESSLRLVNEASSAKLAADAAVASLIRENGRVRLDVDAVVRGERLVPYGTEGRPLAGTTSIAASVDLCSGCLAGPATCANGAAPVPNRAQCIAGVDVSNEVCP